MHIPMVLRKVFLKWDNLIDYGEWMDKKMEFTMKSSIWIIIALVSAGVLWAATTYSYVCPKCGLIETYTMPGIHKCPNDGWMMNPKM